MLIQLSALPSDIDELEEVVEDEDSFLTLLLEHVPVPASGFVVGVDSAEGPSMSLPNNFNHEN